MRRMICLFFLLILLTSCERPATVANWSVDQAASTFTVTASLSTSVKKPSTPSTATVTPSVPIPTLDLNTLPDQLPRSMKGYELVSWEVNGIWNYTLVTGTNREKSFEELMSDESILDEEGWVKITVEGEDQIMKVLSLLPQGEEVLWDGMDLSGQVPEGTLYFSFPPQKIVDELMQFCAEQKIHLYSLQEPQ